MYLPDVVGSTRKLVFYSVIFSNVKNIFVKLAELSFLSFQKVNVPIVFACLGIEVLQQFHEKRNIANKAGPERLSHLPKTLHRCQLGRGSASHQFRL